MRRNETLGCSRVLDQKALVILTITADLEEDTVVAVVVAVDRAMATAVVVVEVDVVAAEGEVVAVDEQDSEYCCYRIGPCRT